MKIGLQTWGTDGDIRPLMALAGELSKSGHDVTVAYTSADNKDYSKLSSLMNIKLIRVYKNFDPDIESVYATLLQCKSNLEKTVLTFKSLFEPAVDAMYEASETLCRENDLVIGHCFVHTLMSAAEKYNCPRVSVVACPGLVESKFTHFPGSPNLGNWLNSKMWRLNDYVLRTLCVPSIDELRKKVGLPIIKRSFERLVLADLTLIQVSSNLYHRPKDWSESVHLCGHFDIPHQSDHLSIPEKLKNFLDEGESPVYFNFGSMARCNIEETKKLFLETANILGRRAIIQADWTDDELLQTSANIFLLTGAPHNQIFPHCSLVVHHGGAGATQSTCRAGLPSVVVEHAFDQQFYGDQLEKFGLSGKTLHRKTVTPKKLADQIQYVLASATMRENAQAIGKKMETENGIAKAVQLIESAFIKKSSVELSTENDLGYYDAGLVSA